MGDKCKLSTKRLFTGTTDVLIIMLLNEDRYTVPQIALLLNRDSDSIKRRIKLLFESGQAKRIHKYLMNSNGLYALKIRRRKRIAV